METESIAENAIQWALDKVGSTEYRLLCLAFVEDAYEKANDIVVYGYSYAKEEAEAFGVVVAEGPPPRGSLVFYDNCGAIDGVHRNWGHVGISLGDGSVVHAWDRVRVDHYLEIEELPPAKGWTNLWYIGWSPVSRVLEGSHKSE